jgi:hypothetical protein
VVWIKTTLPKSHNTIATIYYMVWFHKCVAYFPGVCFMEFPINKIVLTVENFHRGKN